MLWNQADAAGHGGDGDAQPVTVRGMDGVAAPISVFQQTVLPELGTVIAWTEGDLAVGLSGRQWSIGQTEELVAIAELLEADGLVVRVVGIGLPLDAALEVAGAARELTPDEWAALVEAEDRCEPP